MKFAIFCGNGHNSFVGLLNSPAAYAAYFICESYNLHYHSLNIDIEGTSRSTDVISKGFFRNNSVGTFEMNEVFQSMTKKIQQLLFLNLFKVVL